MSTSPILQAILRSLPPTEWPLVFSALRQDALLWASLQDPGCAPLLLAVPRQQAQDWSPANLALASLNRAISLDELKAQPLQPLEPGLRLQALRAYEAWPQLAPAIESSSEDILPDGDSEDAGGEDTSDEDTAGEDAGNLVTAATPTTTITLQQACLLALALRERLRLTGHWQELGTELNTRTPLSLDMWRTPLAILYGLTPEPIDLLRALLHPDRPPAEWALGVHALLCSPNRAETHLEQFQAAIQGTPFSPTQHLLLMRQVAEASPTLAEEIAGWLLNQGFLVDDPTPESALEACQQTILLAETQVTAGDEAQALQSIEQARSISYRLQAEIESAWAYLSNRLDKKENVHPSVTQKVTDVLRKSVAALPHQPESVAILSETESFLSEVLLQDGDTNETHKWLEQLSQASTESGTEAQPPALYLQAARLAQQAGEADLCTNLLTKALTALEIPPAAAQPHSLKQRLQPVGQQYAHDLAELTQIASECGLKTIAHQAARLALTHTLPEPNVLVALGEALYDEKCPQEACPVFEMAVGLLPTHLEARRWLATSLEAQKAWEAALPHRGFTVSHLQSTHQLNSADLHALGHCARQAGQYPVAVKAGLQAIEFNPQDLTAHMLLADTYQQMGDYIASADHYRTVTRAAPANPAAWQGLAQLQLHIGQAKNAAETLRAAAQAIPENVDLHLSLGQILLTEQSLTPALASLQKAYELSHAAGCGEAHPAHDQAALLYGRTLAMLGQHERAREVFEEIYTNPNLDAALLPEVAQHYARALLAVGDPIRALQPLEAALTYQPDQPELHLVYARTLLSQHQDPAQAVQSLQKVLQADPTSLEAQGWLAVGLDELGQSQSAFQVYQKSLETTLAKDPIWRARLSFGLGRTALQLGKPELALAALQEAVQIAPEQAAYQQQLAEAFWAVKLPQNALQVARGVLQIDRDNADTLAWYSDQVLRSLQTTNGLARNHTGEAGDQPSATEAINVLCHALELKPRRADLYTRLARLQILSREPQQAAAALQEILSIDSLPLLLLQEAACLAEDAGSPRLAADLYRRAAQAIKETNAAAYREILLKLAETQTSAQNYHAALQTLRQAISNNPTDARAYLLQAQIFQSLEQPESVINSLESAILNVQQPADQIAVHTHLALALRQQGKYPAAYFHAAQAAELAALSPAPGTLSAQEIFVLAAELAQALLLGDVAQRWLAQAVAAESSSNDASSPAFLLRLHSLNAELALERGDLAPLAAYIETGLRTNPLHPRLVAAQARLLLRQNDLEHAQSAYQSLVKTLPDPQTVSPEISALQPEDYLAAASAAADFTHWEKALVCARQAQATLPLHPAIALNLARLHVQAAEYQHICHELDVVTHAPSFDALAAKEQEACLQYLHGAENLLCAARTSLEEKGIEIGTSAELLRWKMRTPLVFSLQDLQTEQADLPAVNEPAQALTKTAPWVDCPADAAAWLAHLRRSATSTPATLEQVLLQASQQYPDQLAIALQSALHQASSSPLNALAVLAQCTQPNPTYPLAVISLAFQARLHMQAGQLDQAEACLAHALDSWPDEPRWHGLAAAIRQASPTITDQEKLPATFHHLEEAIRLEPKHLPYYLAMGALLLNRQENEPSLEAKATRLLERASRIHATHPEIWLQLAQLHARGGQSAGLDLAARCAEQSIRAAAAQPNNHKDIRAHLLRAEIALRQGQPEQAMPFIENAQACAPDSAQALLAQVRALQAMDQPLHALKVLERVIPLVDDSLSLALQRVELLVQSHEMESALRMLTHLAADYPTHPEVFVLLANTLAQNSDSDGATQAAHMALQVSSKVESSNNTGSASGAAAPLSPQAQAELHHLLGSLSGRSGQLDSAIHHLDQAIHLAPESIDSYLELGQVYQKQRQYQKAQQILRQGMTASPKDYRTFYQSGLALKDSKDYLGSESMLRRAAELAPENVLIRRQLAAVVALNLVHNPRSAAIK